MGPFRVLYLLRIRVPHGAVCPQILVEVSLDGLVSGTEAGIGVASLELASAVV